MVRTIDEMMMLLVGFLLGIGISLLIIGAINGNLLFIGLGSFLNFLGTIIALNIASKSTL